MQHHQIKTHSDGIWISEIREKTIVKQLSQQLVDLGFEIVVVYASKNFEYPYIYQRQDQIVHCRVVDSVFADDVNIWNDVNTVIITDNWPLQPVTGKLLSVLPEFWSIWHFDPDYIDRPATQAYNCFMNRPRGDRSTVFYELIKRNILSLGIVSYNCSLEEYEQEFVRAELEDYSNQHMIGQQLIPYNTVESHGTLEQCIVDSKISLVLETYISDSHIVFSEKLFRCLQLPRPWLLYCSPGSVDLLRTHGFDVLDDMVDTTYDRVINHGDRLDLVLNQLEIFINRQYTNKEYQRFQQAAKHNQQLLIELGKKWPAKFELMLEKIKQI
jgi:hypothetical protein